MSFTYYDPNDEIDGETRSVITDAVNDYGIGSVLKELMAITDQCFDHCKNEGQNLYAEKYRDIRDDISSAHEKAYKDNL